MTTTKKELTNQMKPLKASSNLKQKVVKVVFFRYLIVSAFALVIDYGSYLAILAIDKENPPIIAAISYLIGLFAAYLLSIKKVFKKGWLANSRYIESILFFLSGLMGAVISYISAEIYLTRFGQNLKIAKLVAVVISFLIIYLIRKKIIFKEKVRCSIP
jgi:putative flippase GtrA